MGIQAEGQEADSIRCLPKIMNDEHGKAMNEAVRLGGVKGAWCAVTILRSSTPQGAALWAHHLCSECQRWAETDTLTAAAPGEHPTNARSSR